MERDVEGTGPIGAAVADAVVQAVREFTGRGATQARATVDRDSITVIMQGLLTKVEQRLIEYDREHEVLAMRRTVQEAMADDLIDIVEHIVGRHVTAFMSANHTDPDYSAEIFVLGDPID